MRRLFFTFMDAESPPKKAAPAPTSLILVPSPTRASRSPRPPPPTLIVPEPPAPGPCASAAEPEAEPIPPADAKVPGAEGSGMPKAEGSGITEYRKAKEEFLKRYGPDRMAKRPARAEGESKEAHMAAVTEWYTRHARYHDAKAQYVKVHGEEALAKRPKEAPQTGESYLDFITKWMEEHASQGERKRQKMST